MSKCNIIINRRTLKTYSFFVCVLHVISCLCVCVLAGRVDMNIISWSPMGRIAASFGMDLVVWMPRSDDTVVYRLQGIKTLEYSADGKLLAACVKRKDSDRAGKMRCRWHGVCVCWCAGSSHIKCKRGLTRKNGCRYALHRFIPISTGSGGTRAFQ